MTESAPTAQNYRDHALRLRESARVAARADSRDGMLSIALNYERLARTIECDTTARKIQRAFGFGSFA